MQTTQRPTPSVRRRRMYIGAVQVCSVHTSGIDSAIIDDTHGRFTHMSLAILYTHTTQLDIHST